MKKIKNSLVLLILIFVGAFFTSCDFMNNKYPKEGSTLSIIEANNLSVSSNSTTPKYYITGEVSNIISDIGIFTITDNNENEITIKYCFDKEGKLYTSISEVIKVGYNVTLYSSIKNENGKNLLINATLYEYNIGNYVPPTPVIPSDPIEISIPEALDIANTMTHNTYTTQEYIIEGIITSVTNVTYGNMYIEDEEGNSLYIYGLYDDTGKRYDRLTNKPDKGDSLKIQTVLGKYNDTLQAKAAIILEFVDNNNGGTEEPTEGKNYNVNFLMINDTHGAFLDCSDGNSIGRVDSLLTSLTNKNGKYISIVNGDAFQGTYVSSTLHGRPLVDAFNEMGLSAFVLGNHDFDWGLDKIALYKDGDQSNGEADFPFLGANIYIKGTKTLPSFVEPYTVVEYNNIKVGIIGIIGGNQESDILTKHVENYEFVDDPASIVATHAKYLRSTLGCDSVVVAMHDYNESLNSKLAQLEADEQLDAIFCAHTHQLITQTIQRADGKYISVVENGDKNDTATEVVLSYENSMYASSKNTVYQPENYAISSRIQAIISNYSDLISESERVIGTCSSNLYKSKLGEYAVASLLNYNYSSKGYSFGSIDMAIINTGGVRTTISAGNITRADVFEVFPFENMIVLVNIDGASLKSLYKKNSSYLYTVTSASAGSVESFSDKTIYQLAIIDYVFTSTLSSYDVFDELDPDQYIFTDIIMRNVVIEYIDAIY